EIYSTDERRPDPASERGASPCARPGAPPPLDRACDPLGDAAPGHRDDRERAADLRGVRAVRESRRPALPEPVRRYPVPPLDPPRWLACGRVDLALRPDVAPGDRRPALPRLARAERRGARAAVPPARCSPAGTGGGSRAVTESQTPRLDRRAFVTLGVAGGAASLVAACGWDGGNAVRPRLLDISRLNDWVGEKILFSPTRLARTYTP